MVNWLPYKFKMKDPKSKFCSSVIMLCIMRCLLYGAPKYIILEQVLFQDCPEYIVGHIIKVVAFTEYLNKIAKKPEHAIKPPES